MKKLLFLSVLVLLSPPAVALAQAPSFGLKGGLNMAGFGGERILDSDFRSGLTVGAFAAIPLSEAVSIQPEVVFSQKGARRAAYDYDDMPQDTDAPPFGAHISERTSHQYLEVPVLVRFSPSPSGVSVRPIFFAGPSVGFLLGVEEVHDTDYTEHLNSMEFGLILGGGVEFGRISLDARYNLGLSAVDKDYDASWGQVPGDVKNRTFTVMAGFRLF